MRFSNFPRPCEGIGSDRRRMFVFYVLLCVWIDISRAEKAPIDRPLEQTKYGVAIHDSSGVGPSTCCAGTQIGVCKRFRFYRQSYAHHP